MKEQEKFVKVGTVLLQETSDAIEMDLNGNSKSINPHIEHWLVEDIKKEGFYLYNLDTQRKWVISRGQLNGMLYGNKYVKPFFTISEEEA